MTTDLFRGHPIRDYTTPAAWYRRLLGAPPPFLPKDTEAVWEVAAHRYLVIGVRPEMLGTPCTRCSPTTSTPASRSSSGTAS